MDSHWQLRTGSSSRKIDDWKFVSPFEGDQPISIEVRLFSNDSGLMFKAIASASKPLTPASKVVGVTLREWESESIAELKAMVIRDLNDYVILSSGVVWEDWLEVTVEGRYNERPYSSNREGGDDGYQSSINIQYAGIKRGTHPSLPDRVFMLGQCRTLTKFPSAKRANEQDPDVPKELSDSQDLRTYKRARDLDKEYTYIPDTRENREGLSHIMTAMKDLRQRLADMLQQDNVAHALSSIVGGFPALPDNSKDK